MYWYSSPFARSSSLQRMIYLLDPRLFSSLCFLSFFGLVCWWSVPFFGLVCWPAGLVAGSMFPAHFLFCLFFSLAHSARKEGITPNHPTGGFLGGFRAMLRLRAAQREGAIAGPPASGVAPDVAQWPSAPFSNLFWGLTSQAMVKWVVYPLAQRRPFFPFCWGSSNSGNPKRRPILFPVEIHWAFELILTGFGGHLGGSCGIVCFS